MSTLLTIDLSPGGVNSPQQPGPCAPTLKMAETLCAATMALAQASDPDTIPDTLLDYLTRLVPYDVASVCLVHPGWRLVPHATRGWKQYRNGASCRGCTAAVGTGLRPDHLSVGWSTVLIPDRRNHPEWKPCYALQHVQSCLIVPLVVDGRILGLCELGKQEPGFYTRDHERWAKAMVSQAAAAVRSARMFDQARREREQLQALSRHLVDAQEEERRRIARELHDEASQVLTSLKVQLCLVERKANDPHAVRREVNRLTALVTMVMDSIHRLAVGLRPPCLDTIGLAAALSQYCATTVEEYGVKVEFEPDDSLGRLPPPVETAVYRIIQEALLNVARHARATCVRVVVDRRGDWLTAMVEDDGIGFDPNAVAAKGRLGLVGMHERADALGGKFEIETAPERGTRLYIEVPCGA